MTFLANNKWVLLFYAAIVILIIIFRKRFEIHGKIIALWRMNFGLKFMNRSGKKHSELYKILGYIGIGAGYIGMVIICYVLIKNLITLLIVPKAPSAVSLVIPGVKIPGSVIVVPLLAGWIALFFVIVVHEFAHGLIAKAHGLKIKSSGIFFLGPLMGAFVEPSEKELKKKNDYVQYSIFAAGPFSNVIFAVIAILIISWLVSPAVSAMTQPIGFSVKEVYEGKPAALAGLEPGDIITRINGKHVKTYEDFGREMQCVRANETITVATEDKELRIKTIQHPELPNQDRGFIGISLISMKNEVRLKSEAVLPKIFLNILLWLKELLKWFYILSLGIGLANLLPLGPVDGGRMLQVSLRKLKGKVKGDRWWKNISLFILFVLILNILWPILKSLGF